MPLHFSSSRIRIAPGDETISCAFHRGESTALTATFAHLRRAGVRRAQADISKFVGGFRITVPNFMQIWVDADACPGVIKDILYRAAERARVNLILVANKALYTPPSPWVRVVRVARGFDVADSHIVNAVEPGDLVITADIPLAAAVVEKDAFALNPRGEFYSRENVRELLDLRNFMDGLRSSGIETGGPSAFSQSDRQAFANQLDGFLARQRR